MKKIICALLILTLCVTLYACGKSEAVVAAEEAISAIGTVTIDSGELIANAEKLYGILTDDEKSQVTNRITLADARETFDNLVAEAEAAAEAERNEIIYSNAKQAYEKLKEVSSLCASGMDSIYGAWYFGIYKAKDTTSSNFYTKMAQEVPGFTSKELEAGANELLSASLCATLGKSDWQYSIWIVESAITIRGDYATITANMDEAEKILQTLTTEYQDYAYYPKLKDYYSSIKSYVEFFTSPSGSFNQLADTVNDYENKIRTLDSDVGFLFNK